jgi:hypothetical protein
MQKSIARAAEGRPLQIRSAAAIDHLKGYLYIEAEKESHVREVRAARLGWYVSVDRVPRDCFWCEMGHLLYMGMMMDTTFVCLRNIRNDSQFGVSCFRLKGVYTAQELSSRQLNESRNSVFPVPWPPAQRLLQEHFDVPLHDLRKDPPGVRALSSCTIDTKNQHLSLYSKIAKTCC